MTALAVERRRLDRPHETHELVPREEPSLDEELDETKFQALINQMHQILWEEAPWLGIYNQVDIYGVSRKLNWDARRDERIALFEASWKA